MKAHRTLHEVIIVPITELITYRLEVDAYNMLDAHIQRWPQLPDNVFIMNDSILSGFCMSNSVFFKTTHHLNDCDTYPNQMTHQGYSTKLVLANREANISNPGVLLGSICIGNDISVIEVARALGVSRQTIYNWFTGKVTPPPKTELSIKQFIDELNLE